MGLVLLTRRFISSRNSKTRTVRLTSLSGTPLVVCSPPPPLLLCALTVWLMCLLEVLTKLFGIPTRLSQTALALSPLGIRLEDTLENTPANRWFLEGIKC